MRGNVDVLEHHEGQQAYASSPARFNVAHPGRRGGKSEIAKRRLAFRAAQPSPHREPRFCYAAPTFAQAKAIAWRDLKRMIPKDAMRGKPVETTLTIPLWHGGELFVTGLDKPERIEGPPLDGIVLDEYGNMKAQTWSEHVRPALSTKNRPGWADFIGVPEGRNHYYDLTQKAKATHLEDPKAWMVHHWPSWEIIAAEEIEEAKRDLDDLTFNQEYGGEFVLFAGRAYYGFGSYSTGKLRERYDPDKPIVVCLDFNVMPGVAVIAQEMSLPLPKVGGLEPLGTAVIGDVHIPDNSTTAHVCRRILSDWGGEDGHRGGIEVFGDYTGGARKTSQTEGSDWDIARQMLIHGTDEHTGFGNRVSFFLRPNPTERARVNSVNSRLRSAKGDIKMMVDPREAPNVVRDFEGVVTVQGGTGEIDKKKYPLLSHWTDALGYYVEARFPVRSRGWQKFKATY